MTATGGDDGAVAAAVAAVTARTATVRTETAMTATIMTVVSTTRQWRKANSRLRAVTIPRREWMSRSSLMNRPHSRRRTLRR